MNALDQASVLRRKTRTLREGREPSEASTVKALRLALARAADTLFGLVLTVATVEQRRIDTDEIEAALGSGGLFVLLDGAGGTRGALRLDPALMTGVIEVQTIGQVLPGTVHPRPATRTDAAMVAPLVDAVLAGFDEEMAKGAGDIPPRGLRFGDRADDARALALLLPGQVFDFFRLTVALDHGARTGRFDLLLPHEPPVAPLRRGRAGAERRAGVGPELAAVTLSAPVALDVILARLSLPLRTVMTLAPDTRLTLPRDGLRKTQLLGPGGHLIAEGRLGQQEGWRAVRLSGLVSEPSPGGTTGQPEPRKKEADKPD